MMPMEKKTAFIYVALVLFILGPVACVKRAEQVAVDPKKASRSDANSGSPDAVGDAAPANSGAPTPTTSNATTDQFNAGRDSVDGSASNNATTTTTTSSGNKFETFTGTYNQAKIQEWVAAHRGKNGGGNFKYVYVPEAVVANDKLTKIVRVGIHKAFNHLCFGPEQMVIGEDASAPYGLVWALDITKCWGTNAANKWTILAGAIVKGVPVSPAQKAALQPFDANQPVSADQFVYNLIHGEVYNNLMAWPPEEDVFIATYKVNQNIEKTGYIKNAIVCGPRIWTAHYYMLFGKPLWYFRTNDEFDGRAGGDIADAYKAQAPRTTDFRDYGSMTIDSKVPGHDAVASEYWLQMPNGFIAYGIHGEGKQERSRAERDFAADPYNPGTCLETGRCITCHTSGIHAAPTEPEVQGRNGWTANSDLTNASGTGVYDVLHSQFESSMKVLVNAVSGGDDELNSQMIHGTIEPVLYTLRLWEDRNPTTASGGFACGTCEMFCSGKFTSATNNLCAVGRTAGRLSTGATPGAAGGAGSPGGFLGGLFIH